MYIPSPSKYDPDENGHFGIFGGRYVPGTLMPALLKLKDEYAKYDAEVIYDEILPKHEIEDHKLCICGDILRGMAHPTECTIFGTACKPNSPVGSCMVSSEGACAAYYKYGNLLK